MGQEAEKEDVGVMSIVHGEKLLAGGCAALKPRPLGAGWKGEGKGMGNRSPEWGREQGDRRT